jgi:hypothetical protein
MIFTDEDGQPLEIGTAIDLLPYSHDTGIVGYAPTGEQIIAHYSRRDGTLVLSPPEDFNAGNVPVRIAACVLSAKAGEDVWRDAVEEIETSCPGPLKDYDLIARVYERNVTNPRGDFSGLSFLGGFSSVGHLLPLPKFKLSIRFSLSSHTS